MSSSCRSRESNNNSTNINSRNNNNNNNSNNHNNNNNNTESNNNDNNNNVIFTLIRKFVSSVDNGAESHSVAVSGLDRAISLGSRTTGNET